MRPFEALEKHRDAIRRAANRYGVANPRVFGSTARGDDTEESDLGLYLVRITTKSWAEPLAPE